MKLTKKELRKLTGPLEVACKILGALILSCGIFYLMNLIAN